MGLVRLVCVLVELLLPMGKVSNRIWHCSRNCDSVLGGDRLRERLWATMAMGNMVAGIG